MHLIGVLTGKLKSRSSNKIEYPLLYTVLRKVDENLQSPKPLFVHVNIREKRDFLVFSLTIINNHLCPHATVIFISSDAIW